MKQVLVCMIRVVLVVAIAALTARPAGAQKTAFEISAWENGKPVASPSLIQHEIQQPSDEIQMLSVSDVDVQSENRAADLIPPLDSEWATFHPKQKPVQDEPTLVPQGGHSPFVRGLALSHGESMCLTRSLNGIIRLHDLSTGAEVRSIAFPGDADKIAFLPSTSKALFDGADGVIHVWDVSTGLLLEELKGHTKRLSLLVTSADGHWALSSSADGTSRLWKIEDARAEQLPGLVTSAAFSSDSSMLIFSMQNQIYVRNLKGAIERHSFLLDAPIMSLAFKGPTRFVAATAGCAVRVLDSSSFHEISRVSLPQEICDWSVRSIYLAENGTSAVLDNGVRAWFWDLEANRAVLDPHRHITITAEAISPDGRLVLTTSGLEADALLWEGKTGKPIRTLSGGVEPIHSLAISADTGLVVAGHSDSFGIWDLNAGKQTSKVDVSSLFAPPSVAVAPEKIAIQIASDGNTILVESPQSRKSQLYDLGQNILIGEYGSEALLAPNGRLLFDGGKIFDVTIAESFNAQIDRVFAWTQDSTSLIANRGSRQKPILSLWSVTSRRFEGNDIVWSEGVFPGPMSPDKKWLFSTGPDTAAIHRTSDGLVVKKSEVYRNVFAFSWDSKFAFLATSRSLDEESERGDSVTIWQLNDDGTVLDVGELPGHSAGVSGMAVSQDNQYLLTGSPDGTMRVWDLSAKKEIAKCYFFRDGTWAVVSKDGRFDASGLERQQGLYWVIPDDPMRPLPLEIFMRDYYEPSLLQRLLSKDKSLNVPPAALTTLNRKQPIIKILDAWNTIKDPSLGGVRLSIKGTGLNADGVGMLCNGGTYDLRVFRNGQLVRMLPKPSGHLRMVSNDSVSWRKNTCIDRSLPEVESVEPDGTIIVRVEGVQLPRLADQKKVTFSAYAYNEDRVKTLTASRTFDIPKTLQPRQGKAYVISVGVNRTESKGKWELQYAANDARRMSTVVGDKLESTKQFSEVVRVRLVSDAPDKQEAGEAAATKEHLRAVLDVLAGRREVNEQLKREIPDIADVSKAQPEDVVLLAFSSHGYTDDRGVFHMVLWDIGKHTRQDKVTPELQANSLSSDQLSGWLREVDAGEMVMVVDSCHSAATVEAEGFKPGPMGSRGLGQMAYDKGMRILAASKAKESAVERGDTEGKKVEHGLLSYALIEEGLVQGLADFQPPDGKIAMGEWLAYGEKEVPKLFKEGDAKGVIQVKGGPDTAKEIYHGGKQTRPIYQQPVLFDFAKGSQQTMLVGP